MPADMPEQPTPDLADILIPMPGKIAVLVDQKEEVTKGGIYIPKEVARSIHEERATRGEVIAVGNIDDELETDESAAAPPGILQVGDYVVFGKYTGTKISLTKPGTREKQEIIVMRESDVLCRIVDPEVAKSAKVRS